MFLEGRGRLHWPSAILIVLIAIVLVLLIQDCNVAFLLRQTHVALLGVDWWTFFQAFLFGNDGPNMGFFENATDLVAGIFGLYFITPPSWSTAVNRDHHPL